MSDTSAPKRPPELVVRLVTALGLIAVALLAIVFGGLLFWLLAVALGMVMMAEWADLVAAAPGHKRLGLYALVVPLAIMAPIGAGPGFIAVGLIGAAFFFVGATTRRAWLAWGVVYVAVPILSLLLIRQQKDIGLVYTLWTLALVWACDIGAYFAGRLIGGPKLAPAVSPNKTWAGLIGGMVAASLFALAMHHFYGLGWTAVVATPFLAMLAQCGDLFESWLKRRAGAKDSGTLFPGHGGVLDRLDGVVPVAPAAALLVVVLPKLIGLL
ncbi:phosphatidate cytidylyltransferase [Sphingomonas panacisoli]|uniref:Phosphatidate cytidylyltransferase n=1 Tax=Sphingomonas panacisoli TaxID=1813879 RepID=A0A5B8LIT7_9SPHN|nr:phosphatidate cytidylyltransferase [Sphingomonas panacisoli]QDZ07514.1 phosphatidate cytidylyltransferase [Sphingomonas panacisoli]